MGIVGIMLKMNKGLFLLTKFLSNFSIHHFPVSDKPVEVFKIENEMNRNRRTIM